jgi:hypothetical protein
VALDIAPRTTAVRLRSLHLDRVRTASILAGIVALSFALRAVLAWFHAAPAYFQDEYVYAELARSIAEGKGLTIRGEAAHFPALLHSLLTAPAWLFSDLGIGYRLVQTMGALAMSLAAVPAFLLARSLGFGRGFALAGAVFAVAVPDLVYTGWIVAEPFAYPLVLGAVAAAVSALGRPSRHSQLAFVALAGLAAFTRIQFVALPLCFAAALLVVGLRERRLRAAIREQALPLTLFALALGAAAAVGLGRALGVYRGLLDYGLEPLGLAGSFGTGAMVLVYASGWILVPGALLGLFLALYRPSSRSEVAFGAFAAFLIPGLLFEAAVIASHEAKGIQERYLFYVIPLVVPLFGLYARRGWPWRLPHALLAAALLTVSARLPLSAYTASTQKGDSAFLIAVSQLEETIGTYAGGSIVVAAAAALLSAAAVAASLRPRRGTPVALGLALVACAASGVGVTIFDQRNARDVEAAFLPDDRSWVDHAGVGDVTLVKSYGGRRSDALQQAFWNRSVDRIVLLPWASPADRFETSAVRVSEADGSLSVDGRPLGGPLLVDTYASTVQLRGVERIARSPNYVLLRPTGKTRIALYVPGRYNDGWLTRAGAFNLWPAPGQDRLAGRLTFTVTAPPEAVPLTLTFNGEGLSRKVTVQPGTTRTLSLPACSRGHWGVEFLANAAAQLDTRLVSVRTSTPVYRADADACRASARRSL